MSKSKNVKVVVLGDIGRSPRMQYHSLSLAEAGHIVDIIGYGETQPMENVKLKPSVFYHYLMPCPQLYPKIFNYVFKTIWQSLNLLFLLFLTRRADYLLVQNPPAIPALIICWIYAKIIGAKFIIDWHNYAHTIMAMSVGERSALVKITKKVEAYIGKKADYNFCVTRAMKDDLLKQWGIKAITLYDRPPKKFSPITLNQKHDILKKLSLKFDQLSDSKNHNYTAFTQIVNGSVELKPNRPGLLISSTSWTEDEDFSVLFSALQEYEDSWKNGNVRNLPKLICVITGKGHLRDYYCKKIAAESWKHVTVLTPWLEDEEYPLLLASADLGVSLHTSSSGLDLPMKVVDMFGCGLPVCAYDFKCLNELVENGKNGYTFKDSKELSNQIQDWFESFPNNEKRNNIEQSFKQALKQFDDLRWDENWNTVAVNVFK